MRIPMSFRVLWSLNYLLVIFLILAVFLILFSSPLQSASPPILNTERKFQLSTVTDPSRKVTEEIFKGKVTVLNVWASWCGPCRTEIDALLTLSKYPGVYWVGLNLNDELMEAQKILMIYGNPYHETIYDKEGRLAINLGVRGTPEVFILDKLGRIHFRHVGRLNETIWKERMWPIIQNLQEN